MRRVFALLLLSAACAWAQQPTTDPNQNPPSPAAPGAAQQPTPTPQGSQQDKSGVNSQIQDNIKDVLSGDPALNGASVDASVDDSNIILTGTVQSEGQLNRVMQLVGPYAGYRKVVNKVQVR